jgi:molybdopterin-guanine dinucleotide biosynthesis protein A
MGRDKALVPIDGVPLAARVAAVLRRAGADPVLAVGGDLGGLRAAGLDAVADPHQGHGPLGGIATALTSLRDHDVVVVLACDLIAASAAAVGAVVDALRAAPGASVAVPVAGGRAQPLHAAWRPAARAAVEAGLASDDLAVRAVLAGLETVTVEGLDPAWFANANTPADVDSAALGHTGGMSDATVPEIDVAELARRRAEGAFVLDVRQQDEYDAGHVPGAVLVPLDQLEGRLGDLPDERPLLVICKSGGRSAAAVRALGAAGYDATNVAGGTMAWIEAGQPVIEGPTPE